MVSKEEYINSVVDTYTDLLNQTVACINKKWEELQLDLTDIDFKSYLLGNDKTIRRDFEEQYVLTILGVLNMASVRVGLKDLNIKLGENNTEINVVEFLLNDKTKEEADRESDNG